MWSMVEEAATRRARMARAVRDRLPAVEAEVAAGRLAPTLAATEILGLAGWEELP
ncbi:hypothetical protein WDZ92_40870 [Nostoc sp. NIES-2111]